MYRNRTRDTQLPPPRVLWTNHFNLRGPQTMFYIVYTYIIPRVLNIC